MSQSEKEKKVTASAEVRSALGLHATPSRGVANLAASFGVSTDIELKHEGLRVNGKSFMGVMRLGAGPGSTVEISASGAEALEAVKQLKNYIEVYIVQYECEATLHYLIHDVKLREPAELAGELFHIRLKDLVVWGNSKESDVTASSIADGLSDSLTDAEGFSDEYRKQFREILVTHMLTTGR